MRYQLQKTPERGTSTFSKPLGDGSLQRANGINAIFLQEEREVSLVLPKVTVYILGLTKRPLWGLFVFSRGFLSQGSLPHGFQRSAGGTPHGASPGIRCMSWPYSCRCAGKQRGALEVVVVFLGTGGLKVGLQLAGCCGVVQYFPGTPAKASLQHGLETSGFVFFSLETVSCKVFGSLALTGL